MIKTLTARLTGLSGRPYHLDGKCIYLVSVGKNKFEDNFLLATLGLINSEFKQCDIIVAGTLQRFNYAAKTNRTLSEAFPKAARQEKLWIDNVKPYIKLISTQCSFIPWETYIKHENFIKYYHLVCKWYKEDEVFKSKLNETVDEYCTRNKTFINNNSNVKLTKFREYSELYLLEECAAMFMWEQCPIIYPGKASPILAETIERINQLKNSNNLKWIPIRFESKEIASWDDISASTKQNFLDTAYLQKPNIINDLI